MNIHLSRVVGAMTEQPDLRARLQKEKVARICKELAEKAEARAEPKAIEKEEPVNQKCRFCGADTVGSDVCWKCLDNPERQKAIEEIKKFKPSKSYPVYAAFCDDPEQQTGFKPARVAQWLAQNEHFKTDRKTDILYYGDGETGKWTQNGETRLAEICAVILGEENKAHHYTNILHSLKGLTYMDIDFSKKLACLNGILDPVTLDFKQFSLEEMTVYTTSTNYKPEAKCEDWLEFLKQVVSLEDALTLQEWSGYLLLPDYPFHKLMWIHGAGRNGKGVWQRTMEGVLGSEMVSGVGLEELDGNHRFAVRQLYGKLFNPCSEPTTNRILQTALLKKATGQDTISAECKGKDKRIDFRNIAKITVLANKFPKVKDETTAFSERRLFISFPNEFKGKDAIPNLEKAWLNNPEKKSGILNWMLEGLQRLLTQGYFTESKSQLETEIAFERASDTISAFLKEMAVYGKDYVTYRSYAWDCYKEYCEIFGLEQESDKKFTQRLKETRGITPCKKDGDRAWRGVTFRNINEDGEIIDLTRTERTDRTRFPPSVKITEYQNSREE
jgi:P4 family phage/plasmid primase-like protien